MAKKQNPLDNLNKIAAVEKWDAIQGWLGSFAGIGGGVGIVTSLFAWVADRPLFELIFYGVGAWCFTTAALHIRTFRKEYSETQGKVIINSVFGDWEPTVIRDDQLHRRYTAVLVNGTPFSIKFRVKRFRLALAGEGLKDVSVNPAEAIVPPGQNLNLTSDFVLDPEGIKLSDKCEVELEYTKLGEENWERLEQTFPLELFGNKQIVARQCTQITHEKIHQ